MQKIIYCSIYIMLYWGICTLGIAQNTPYRLKPQELLHLLEYHQGQHDISHAKLHHNDIHKCLTPYIRQYYQDQHNYPLDIAHKINQLLTAPNRSEDYLSSTKRFRIHYDTTGHDAVRNTDNDNNGIPDYVEYAAMAAEESWTKIVSELEYVDPFLTDRTLNIYFSGLRDGFYGYTDLDCSSSNDETCAETLQIYITLNSSYEDFDDNDSPLGSEIGNLQVTVAHEFQHVVQYVTNYWRGDDDYSAWIEMDATLMEEVVYDNVNDYYHVISKESGSSTIPSVFSKPTKSTPVAYSHVTHLLYFYEEYGDEFMRDVWRELQKNTYLPFHLAMENVSTKQGRLFQNDFTGSFLWHYATGSEKGNYNYGFEERTNYPTIETSLELENLNIMYSDSVGVNGLASHIANVTSTTLLSTTDKYININSSSSNPEYLKIGVIALLDNNTAYTQIINGNDNNIVLPITIDNIDHLAFIAVNSSTKSINYSLSITTTEELGYLVTQYPNPANTETYLDIHFEDASTSFMKLDIYNILGQHVTNLLDVKNIPQETTNYKVSWNTSQLASGIYIYRWQHENGHNTGKITVVH